MPKKKTFEESIEKLRETVMKLESGECTLEESMKLYEEGVKLSQECYAVLNAAEQKITQVTGSEE